MYVHTINFLEALFKYCYIQITERKRQSSASEKFIKNNIVNFYALLRKEVYSFFSKLKVPTNVLINCIGNR